MGKGGYNNTSIQKRKVTAFDVAEVHPASNYQHQDGAYKKGGVRITKNDMKWFAEFSALMLLLYGGHQVLKTSKYTQKSVDNFDAAMTGSADFIYNQLIGLPGYVSHMQNVQVNIPEKQLSSPPNKTNVSQEVSVDEEYQFSPDIEIHGSPAYKEKVYKALEEIKRVDIDEYNEVKLYLEVVRDGPDSTVGEGVVTITERTLDTRGPFVLVHEKEHVKQGLEPTYSLYYNGKSGWYMELDAVKKEAEEYAKAYNLTEEQKLQRFKVLIAPYKQTYPKEYAQFFPEN